MQITHAALAARLLRDAAEFFVHLGQENAEMAQPMAENAAIYNQVADMVEQAPMHLVDINDEA